MRTIIAYSMVVPLQPAEKCPSMKRPVGKFTLPLKVAWLNSYEKVVDDIDMDVGWVVEIVKDNYLAISPNPYSYPYIVRIKEAIPSGFPSFDRLLSYDILFRLPRTTGPHL